MLKSIQLPRIEPELAEGSDEISTELYARLIGQIIQKVAPKGTFDATSKPEELKEQYACFKESFPVFAASELKTPPCDLSFYLLCNYRQNAFKFFFEMVSRWLYPGRRLNAVFIHGMDFRMPEVSSDLLTAVQIIIRVESEAELRAVKKNLPVLRKEVRLGVPLASEARRILEIKGLAIDEKTAMIHDYLAGLIERRPKDLEPDIFNEAQHLLVMCPEGFKAKRHHSHIGRMICVNYLFRKWLKRPSIRLNDKRHLYLKLSKISVEEKEVLGIMVGMNFFGKNEIFEQEHLLKAIRNYMPHAQPIEGSFLKYVQNRIGTFYLEIEKGDGSTFSLEEISRLRRELPSDLKDRIEHLMHPIFMPRNEEEILRNVLMLSQQVKYLRDLPHVMISFDAQTQQNLEFTVIIVRILNPEKGSNLEKELSSHPSFSRVTVSQCKHVGLIRNKYRKEGSVSHVELPKLEFLRGDYSLDLFKARRKVVAALGDILGEIRDYNGGMISKQNEAFSHLQESLGTKAKNYDFLLENFFFSIQPAVMRNVLSTSLLKVFFSLLLDVVDESFFKGQGGAFQSKVDSLGACVILTSEDPKIKGKIDQAIAGFDSRLCVSTFVHVYETPCYGYLFNSPDFKLQEEFISTIRQEVGVRPGMALV